MKLRLRYSPAEPSHEHGRAITCHLFFFTRRTQAAQQYHETGCLDASALSQPQEGGAGDGDGGAPRAYRCRKCRALVATQHNVVEAEQVGCLLSVGVAFLVLATERLGWGLEQRVQVAPRWLHAAALPLPQQALRAAAG